MIYSNKNNKMVLWENIALKRGREMKTMNYFDVELFLNRVNNELFKQSDQAEIEAITHLKQSTISKLQNRKIKTPSIDTIYAISRGYQVNVDWLVGVSQVREIETIASEQRNICEALGLSDSAIMSIQGLKDTPTGKGLESLLEIHRACADNGRLSLLDDIADFLNTAFDYSANDVEITIDKNGSLIAQPSGSTENKAAKAQAPLAFSNLSFTLAEVKLEKQIQKIENELRARKEMCIKKKNKLKSK